MPARIILPSGNQKRFYRDPAKRAGRLRQRHGLIVKGKRISCPPHHDYEHGFPLIRSLRASTQRSTSVLFSFVLSLLIMAGSSAVRQIKNDSSAIWTADAHRGDGKRFVVRADEKLTGFAELELGFKRSNELIRRYNRHTVADHVKDSLITSSDVSTHLWSG